MRMYNTLWRYGYEIEKERVKDRAESCFLQCTQVFVFLLVCVSYWEHADDWKVCRRILIFEVRVLHFSSAAGAANGHQNATGVLREHDHQHQHPAASVIWFI